MDTIASLKPDLILATTDLPAAAVKQMRKVAPVLTVKASDAADPIGQMNKNLDLIAKATGTTEQAAKLKKDFEAKLAAGKRSSPPPVTAVRSLPSPTATSPATRPRSGRTPTARSSAPSTRSSA
ncbi:ABC transporter substrate-binding protein [Streptomyces alboflavus]|uniref:ABC transporter substrate-binding protein n=1 Tax=Streptomyces alboflavus TaxID=67267 RepID=A0A1Z1WQ35_9ACTN|nr:ABC transporter substrate-binding protein [Streptomyces alboflavus]